MTVEQNILFGKKLALNGDSICAGAGHSGGYGAIIAERNGMTVQNIAVGGATVTAEQYYLSDPTKLRHCVCRTVELMDADADYAIVDGGVNDASLGIPMGKMSEGYDAELDETTFIGAFESMLRRLTLRFAGKKIGYVAVHKMDPAFVSGETPTYYHAARACCEKWGVPFCDLNVTCPAFAFFPESDPALYALRARYTHKADGWHPNEEGYRKYYCDRIEAWMRTL